MLRFLCVLLVAVPLHAVTYEMVRDEHLAADANAIVVGRVMSARYEVAIERVLKGELGASTIVLRVPGGPGLHIDGVPRFETGDRVLLFLVANDDGTFSPLHLALGAFRDDAGLAVRDASVHDRGRDFERFADWVEHRTTEYFVQDVASHYSFLQWHGDRLRWFNFQEGATVQWHVDEHVDVAQRAMRVWNDEWRTLVSLDARGGATAAGLRFDDGRNSILYGDPNNEIPGRYVCGRGGVMGMAGTWLAKEERLTHRGTQFVPIRGADIIINDGIECHANTLPLEETLTHELGHTLGLGHACGEKHNCDTVAANEAVMRAAIHLDGRGGQLSSDDVEALQTLYTREGPIVGFTYTLLHRAVQFNVTTDANAELQWDFGDGSAPSSLRAPRHTYEAPGHYTVRLRATDETGTNEILRTIVVGARKRRATR